MNAIANAHRVEMTKPITMPWPPSSPSHTAAPMATPANSGSDGRGLTPGTNNGIPAHHAPRIAAIVGTPGPATMARTMVTAIPVAARMAMAGCTFSGCHANSERLTCRAGPLKFTGVSLGGCLRPCCSVAWCAGEALRGRGRDTCTCRGPGGVPTVGGVTAAGLRHGGESTGFRVDA